MLWKMVIATWYELFHENALQYFFEWLEMFAEWDEKKWKFPFSTDKWEYFFCYVKQPVVILKCHRRFYEINQTCNKKLCPIREVKRLNNFNLIEVYRKNLKLMILKFKVLKQFLRKENLFIILEVQDYKGK